MIDNSKLQLALDLIWNTIGVNDTLVDGKFKALRVGQLKAHTTLYNHDRRIMQAVTGFGKSINIKALTATDAATGFKCIITVPQRVIANGFGIDAINVPELGNHIFDVFDDYNLVNGKRQLNDATRIDQVITFLKSDGTDVLLCTHMTYVSAIQYIEDSGMIGILENTSHFIDEVHHSKYHLESADEKLTNKMGKIIQLIDSLDNVRMTLVTATLFRGDRYNLLPQARLDEFALFKWSWEDHFTHSVYLKGFGFKIAIFDNSKVNDPFKILRHGFKDYIGHSIVHLPNINTNFYKLHGVNKHELTTKIMKCAVNGKWKHVVNTQYSYWEITTQSRGRVIAVDLVDKQYREKASNYIRDYGSNAELGPNLIIALNLFREGADCQILNRSFIMGYRESFQELVQLIGRPSRDIKGKSRFDVTYMIGKPANDDDDSVEQFNTVTKAIVATMMMEHIIKPPSLFKEKQHAISATIYDSIDPNVKKAIWEYIFQTLCLVDLSSDYLVSNTIVTDTIIQAFDKYNAPHTPDIIKHYYNTYVDMLFNKLNAANGIDVNNIDINMITQLQSIEGIQYVMSNVIGKKAFNDFRMILDEKNNEKEGLKRIVHIVEFYHKTGKNPSGRSSKQHDAACASWLTRMKGAKHGTHKDATWYPSYLDRAIELGYPDMFEIRSHEQEGLKRVEYIAKFYKKTGHDPQQRKSSGSASDFRCATWLSEMRSTKAGIRHISIFYPSFLDRAIELGYPDMFKLVTREHEGLLRVEYIAKFYKKNGHSPQKKSSDAHEATCAVWLARQKKTLLGNNKNSKWYPSFLVRAIELGHPDMFKFRSYEQEGLQRVDDLADIYNKKGIQIYLHRIKMRLVVDRGCLP